jgi:uncharacterized protein (TIGR03118 family)
VDKITSSFKKTFAVVGVAGAWSAAALVYGCSSSSTPAAPPPEDSGLPDTSPPMPDAGTTNPDANTTPDASAILQKVTETKLFANAADAGASNVDPNLQNPWGLAFNPSGPAWVSNNSTGVASVYAVNKGAPVLTVTVPVADGGTPPSAPSGQIFNPSADFMGDKFISCTEDGTISGWQPAADGGVAASATLRVDNSTSSAVYKGLAIVTSTPQLLLAADFHNDRIDAFNADYTPVAADAGAAKWVDTTIPSGYAPFNIVTVGSSVYVLYAKQDNPANAMDNAKGAGTGAVSVFDLTGALVKSLIPTGRALNAPWGLATVPTGGWGSFAAGTLLIGDFGDGLINGFDPTSGALLGTLVTASSLPLSLDGLWAIEFGVSNADAGESNQQLYFTAGPNDEANGLFGYLTVAQ